MGGDALITPGWPRTAEHFSVALELGDGDGDLQKASVQFLAPHLASAHLTKGALMLLMEGGRRVAEAEILTVNQDPSRLEEIY